MKRLMFLPLILGTLMLTACPPLEQNTRDGIATAKGYLDSAKSLHPECPAAQSTVCNTISRGVAAKDTLIDALNLYCASPSYSDAGGVCVPDKQAAPKLKAALANLNQTMADVKAIGGK